MTLSTAVYLNVTMVEAIVTAIDLDSAAREMDTVKSLLSQAGLIT